MSREAARERHGVRPVRGRRAAVHKHIDHPLLRRGGPRGGRVHPHSRHERRRAVVNDAVRCADFTTPDGAVCVTNDDMLCVEEQSDACALDNVWTALGSTR